MKFADVHDSATEMEYICDGPRATLAAPIRNKLCLTSGRELLCGVGIPQRDFDGWSFVDGTFDGDHESRRLKTWGNRGDREFFVQ